MVSYATLMQIPWVEQLPVTPDVAEQVEIQAKYHGYIDRQQDEIARNLRDEETRLPQDLDYAGVRGLSAEAVQKLNRHRPDTLGQAYRIPGITPATISLLRIHLKKRSIKLKRSA